MNFFTEKTIVLGAKGLNHHQLKLLRAEDKVKYNECVGSAKVSVNMLLEVLKYAPQKPSQPVSTLFSADSRQRLVTMQRIMMLKLDTAYVLAQLKLPDFWIHQNVLGAACWPE